MSASCFTSIQETIVGASGAVTLTELVEQLETPRIIWIMVPHQVVDSVITELTPLLSKGDILIEAGNSHYKESIRRHEQLKEHGIYFMDAGTSGGMEGAFWISTNHITSAITCTFHASGCTCIHKVDSVFFQLLMTADRWQWKKG